MVIVDWSAAATPRTGPDSIWIHERTVGGDMVTTNPPTRLEAAALLADRLSDLTARGYRVLLGFDFAFGYPAGFAARMVPHRPDWSGVWSLLSSHIKDGHNNANNRFAVAASFNQHLTEDSHPFWGHPASERFDFLKPKHPNCFDQSGSLGEWRLTDRRISGPQSVWKLAYAGSVGSQSLMGIPILQGLRHHPWLRDRVAVWPFETGFQPPQDTPGSITLVEVYPSLVATEAREGEVRDETQVKSLAEYYMALDASGDLHRLFSGPSDLTDGELKSIIAEEGWIFGIDHHAERLPTANSVNRILSASPNSPAASPVTDPTRIYQDSFALIRKEADLTAIDPVLEPVAVRLIHACGMVDLAQDMEFRGDLLSAMRTAFAKKAPVLTDTQMVAHGVIRSKLPAEMDVLCRLNDPGVAALAEKNQTTRSAAAVDLWAPDLDGAIVTIGNAPTALFRLLDLIRAGGPRPAIIIGVPVGFIGAIESKQALSAFPDPPPFLTIHGRRGGSAMAAAAVNALADLAAGRPSGGAIP